MISLTLIQKIVIWAIPVIFAITLHEVAHGFVAYRLGDPTAKMVGRLTLNPIRHIDPIGTIVVPLGLLLFSALFGGGGMLFGWAKPVPIGVRNLPNPRRDLALVSAAGPISNLLMAVLWALIIRAGFLLWSSAHWFAQPMVLAGCAGIFINAILMIFNLIPLPPLDGGRVLSSLLPPSWSMRFDRIEPYGFIILILLLLSGTLGVVLGPLLFISLHFFALFAGLSTGQLLGIFQVLT